MKQIILSILLATALINPVFNQQNKETLIKELEEKLKNNTAIISQILTDKKYDVVHPETSFREVLQSRTNFNLNRYNSREKNKSDRHGRR